MKQSVVAILLLFIACALAKQNTSTPAAIEETAYQFLWSHLCQGERWGMKYFFFRPSLGKYSASQWLWDSSTHMITWSHRNVTNSILSLQTMLQFQQKDGFIPEIEFWGYQGFKGEIINEIYFGNQQFAKITQTPVLSFSLLRIYQATRSVELLRKFIYPLYNYFVWWVTTRDLTNSGLVTIIHGWESGMDASPAYDEAYFLDNPQPHYSDLYPKFIELILTYHDQFHWNMTLILDRKTGTNNFVDNFFFVEDTMVNSVLAAGFRMLAGLALELNDTSLHQNCVARQMKIEKAIISKLWQPELGRFASAMYRKVDGTEAVARAETAQSLIPLLLETLPDNMRKAIINSQLKNTSRFWTDYPIPSVSISDPAFQPVFGAQGDLLWRGPTWPIINFFVIEGLLLHNETQTANQLMQRWISLYEKSGIWEDYNPLDGAPYGEVGLGMSNLIVDSMYRVGVLKK